MCLSGKVTLMMINAKFENRTEKKLLAPQLSLSGEWRELGQ